MILADPPPFWNHGNIHVEQTKAQLLRRLVQIAGIQVDVSYDLITIN